MLAESVYHQQMLGVPVPEGMSFEALTEERPATLKEAATKVGLQMRLETDRAPWVITGRDYQKSKDWREIVDALARSWQHESPDLLFVDTLGKWAAMTDINAYSEALRAFEPLEQLSAAFPRTSILVTHHARKAGGNAVDSAVGSVGLPGAADNNITMDAPDANDPTLRRLRYSCRIMPKELPGGEKWIRWNPDTGFYSGARKGAAHEDLIRELLNEAENPMTATEIRDGAEWPTDPPSESTIKRCLNRMADADLVRYDGGKGRGGAKRWWLSTGSEPTC